MRCHLHLPMQALGDHSVPALPSEVAVAAGRLEGSGCSSDGARDLSGSGEKEGGFDKGNQASVWSFSTRGCDPKWVWDTGVLGAVCSWTVLSTPDAAVSPQMGAEHPGGCCAPG